MISDNKLYMFIYFRMSSVAPAYVNTRGRAYQCSRCGDAVVDIKIKIMAHIFSTHLRIDQAPYYCTACQETAVTGRRILEHSMTEGHISRCRSIGMPSQEALIINRQPYTLQQPRDFVRYDREISNRIFNNRARVPTPSPLASPVSELRVEVPEVAAMDLTPVSPDMLQQAFETAGISPLDDDCKIIEDIRPQIFDFDDGPLEARWFAPLPGNAAPANQPDVPLPDTSASVNQPDVPLPDAPAPINQPIVPEVQQAEVPSTQTDRWAELLAASQRQTTLLQAIKEQMERQTTALTQVATALEKVKMPGIDGDRKSDDRRSGRYHDRTRHHNDRYHPY